MPKSSSDRRTPASRRRPRMRSARSGSAMTLPSVTSSVSRRGGSPCSVEQAEHLVDDGLVGQAARRQVDRDAQRVARPVPAGRGLDARVEHEAGERHDEAGLLGERDEAVGREGPEPRVVPAHEGLDADDLAVGQPRLGLDVHGERALLQRRPQVGRERQPLRAGRARAPR